MNMPATVNMPATGSEDTVECVICARDGDGAQHPGTVGGNVYEDAWWYAYHAPPSIVPLGQLFLVSKRHFLDFAEMTPDEAASYGSVLVRLVAAIKQTVDAERVYVLSTVEGVPHFHARLAPRPHDEVLREWALLASERSCGEAEALAVAERLRELLMGG